MIFKLFRIFYVWLEAKELLENDISVMIGTQTVALQADDVVLLTKQNPCIMVVFTIFLNSIKSKNTINKFVINWISRTIKVWLIDNLLKRYWTLFLCLVYLHIYHIFIMHLISLVKVTATLSTYVDFYNTFTYYPCKQHKLALHSKVWHINKHEILLLYIICIWFLWLWLDLTVIYDYYSKYIICSLMIPIETTSNISRLSSWIYV